MDIWKPDVLCKAGLILGEGARWHAEWQKFLFIDIKSKLLGTCNPVSGKVVIQKNIGNAWYVIGHSLFGNWFFN